MAENDSELRQRLEQKDGPPSQDQDIQGQPDTDGRDEGGDNLDPGVQKGGETAKPDAVTRVEREQVHALTPAEERKAMNERMSAKRKAAREQADEAGGDLSEASVERAQEPPPQRPAGTPQADPVDAGRKFKLRVNGADVEVPEAELIRRAQMATASEDSLSQAKQVLAEARRLRDEDIAARARAVQDAQRRPDSGHQRTGDETGQDEPPRNQGPLNLRETAEALQTGDVEDAEQALSRFAEGIRREQPGLSPDEVAGRAMQLIEQQNNARQFEAHFAKEHPEFLNQPGRQLDLYHRTHAETLKELASLVNTETGEPFPAHALAQVQNDPPKAAEWLGKYLREGVKRRDGHPPSNPLQVLDRAANALKEEYGLRRRENSPPVDPNRQQLRVAEKRNLSEPRPAQTGQRQGQPQQQRLTDEQRRHQAVEKRKAASGFSTA